MSFPSCFSCKRVSIFAPADIVEGIEGAAEDLDRELGVPLRTHAVATIKELNDKVRVNYIDKLSHYPWHYPGNRKRNKFGNFLVVVQLIPRPTCQKSVVQ